MHVIYKYELGIKETQKVLLPSGAKILRVDNVEGKIYLWAMVRKPKEGVQEMSARTIRMFKTGQDIDTIHLEYLGFCGLYVGEELGLYVFEEIPKYELR